MQKVYSAANVIDAQLLCDRLQAQGIEAVVNGGYLTGAVGELPPDQLVGVWIVHTGQLSHARKVVEAYEQALANDEKDSPCPHCGEENHVNFRICWHCGEVL